MLNVFFWFNDEFIESKNHENNMLHKSKKFIQKFVRDFVFLIFFQSLK